MIRPCLLALVLAPWIVAETPDPAYEPLTKAYAALRTRSYEIAVSSFEEALAKSPKRASIYKDLGYTLLKIGETEAARDQFERAMLLDPADDHVALEYAFLCHETKQQAAARRVFDRIRRKGNPVAEAAFQNIDRGLADGLARWTQAVELSPANFSTHEELAKLAEQRDDAALAAEHYLTAWKLRPDHRAFLLDLGRVWKAQGRGAEAHAALLAASRGAESRVAEAAGELLPNRYPYVYEFEAALRLDPKSALLRRELAYLLLEMGKKAEAEEQFRQLVQLVPDDVLSMAQLGFLRLGRNDLPAAMPLLEQVLKSDDEELVDRVREALKLPRQLRKRPQVTRSQTSAEAKQLAQRSLDAGYLKDALNYLRIAHENDPVDFDVILKLGWTNNILRDDHAAIEWFRLARKSPDDKISSEASRAYENLRPGLARSSTTVWAFPFYSSRWRDVFTYAQAKTEFKLGTTPLRVYTSARFSGDARGKTTIGPVINQYLSEDAVILGGGVSTVSWRGIRGWAEAGMSGSYFHSETGSRFSPDYRGGVSAARGFGHNLGANSHGVFVEANGDAVYISRFENDFLFYMQSKSGFTLPKAGSLQMQLYWNLNATTDLRRLYWANTFDNGPGVRFHFDGMPPSLTFSVNALRGRYLLNEENPLGRRYTDLRAGFWYAFTH